MDAGEIDYRGLDLRLLNVFTTDIDSRLKDLASLVSLQETELALMWLCIIAQPFVVYSIVKMIVKDN